MKLFIFLLSLFLSLQAQEAIQSISKQSKDNLFITDYEYGQMLYKNPRGIGCIKCHGKDGKKMFISKYTHKTKEIKIYAPSIENLTFEKFKSKLKSNTNTKSIMPTYFLTDDEIKSIYTYIENK